MSSLGTELIYDVSEFVKEHNIKRLSQVKNVEVEQIYEFVERLLCNFEDIEKDEEDNDEEYE